MRHNGIPLAKFNNTWNNFTDLHRAYYIDCDDGLYGSVYVDQELEDQHGMMQPSTEVCNIILAIMLGV